MQSPTKDATARALIALAQEVVNNVASAERIRRQVEKLAEQYGVDMPAAIED